MRIEYKNNNLRKVCTDYTKASKSYGERMAELIHLRIDQLMAADSADQMVKFSIGRCHPLHGDREGQYALDLVHPHRLIFIRVNDEIKIVRIVEIVDDYH